MITLNVIWYLIGVVSYIYWELKQFDITLGDVPIMLLIGFLGPIAFLVMGVIYFFDRKDDIIIFKKRK